MADVLDQSEVDALLAAVAGGEVEQEKPEAQVFTRPGRDAASVEIARYDFKRPERVSKDQMRALHTLHETFARNFGASLSGFLRTIVEVKVAACEQMTYSEFTSGLPNPTSFNLVEADGLEGTMCFEISPLIIFPIIDRLLGGNTQELYIPQRPLTNIETRLVSNVTNRGLAALAESWASVRKLSFKISASESNPQLVQIVPPNEVVVVVSFELKMATRAGTMNLCIPFTVIEPVMELLSSQNWFATSKNVKSKEIEASLTRNLVKAPVRVAGLLAQTTMTLHDLLHLAPGDLIVTQTDAARPVVLCVEDEKKFLAQVGQFKGRRALRILRPVTVDDRV